MGLELRTVVHYPWWNNMGSLGTRWESLAGCTSLAGSLGLCLPDLVGVNSVQEILSALAVLHMLHAKVNPLGQDLSAHALVDHHSHCALGHVENTSSLAMI